MGKLFMFSVLSLIHDAGFKGFDPDIFSEKFRNVTFYVIVFNFAGNYISL